MFYAKNLQRCCKTFLQMFYCTWNHSLTAYFFVWEMTCLWPHPLNRNMTNTALFAKLYGLWTMHTMARIEYAVGPDLFYFHSSVSSQNKTSKMSILNILVTWASFNDLTLFIRRLEWKDIRTVKALPQQFPIVYFWGETLSHRTWSNLTWNNSGKWAGWTKTECVLQEQPERT